MKRRQKRYGSEEEILAAINKAKSNMAKLRVKLATDKKLTDEQVLAINARVRTYENATIPNLITTLAAFRTMLLPGITEDNAVVLERR